MKEGYTIIDSHLMDLKNKGGRGTVIYRDYHSVKKLDVHEEISAERYGD